ncbi:MAG: hypothetical protein M1832_005980 [Thelocarpon impressellum]|nr:MAG: hypothetical protein M1832_005980 [Thelocarpon impressellum]
MGWLTGSTTSSSSRHGHGHSSRHHEHGGGYSSSRHRHSSTSSYGRRPRDGYIARVVHKLRRFLRDLLHYARRHPMKVLMMVVMPLITGGALTGILRTLGIRLPAGLMGGMSRGRGFGGSGDVFGGRSSGGMLGAMAGGGGIQGLMKIAQAFM